MAICLAVTFVMTLMIIGMVGPAIETRYFPAVSKLRISSIRPGDNGESVITAEFKKLRSCEYVGIAWFRGKPNTDFERVPVILLRKEGDTSSPDRPIGVQRAGPWIIGMSPSELQQNSFARLSHRCHALWVTTTEFFP